MERGYHSHQINKDSSDFIESRDWHSKYRGNIYRDRGIANPKCKVFLKNAGISGFKISIFGLGHSILIKGHSIIVNQLRSTKIFTYDGPSFNFINIKSISSRR